jgi:Ni/Co efflux regulator RcnB
VSWLRALLSPILDSDALSIRRAALCVTLPSVAACHSGQPRTLTPDEQARWTRDSARYVQDSVKWVHDSVVRDSISRTVDTDSLYRLYHRMLVAPDPVPIMLLVNCEAGRLTWQYGTIPGMAAIGRMEDTLWRPAERDATNRMWEKIHNMSVEEMTHQSVSPSKCGWQWGRKMPEPYRGTELNVLPSRPQRPARP